MNTDVAFRNHEQDLNILNINLNNIYINHDHDNISLLQRKLSVHSLVNHRK